jgi:cell division protein FtsX
MMRRWLYIFDEAFRTVRRHKGLTSISVIIMSLSLLMLAVFLLATDNVLKLVGQAQDEMKMYVYLEDGTSDAQIENLQRQILAQDEVSTVTFVSRRRHALGAAHQPAAQFLLGDAQKRVQEP